MYVQLNTVKPLAIVDTQTGARLIIKVMVEKTPVLTGISRKNYYCSTISILKSSHKNDQASRQNYI